MPYGRDVSCQVGLLIVGVLGSPFWLVMNSTTFSINLSDAVSLESFMFPRNM